MLLTLYIWVLKWYQINSIFHDWKLYYGLLINKLTCIQTMKIGFQLSMQCRLNSWRITVIIAFRTGNNYWIFFADLKQLNLSIINLCIRMAHLYTYNLVNVNKNTTKKLKRY